MGNSSDVSDIFVLAVLVIISGFFSAAETAFTSLNRVRIKNMATDGNKRAKLVLKLVEDYDKLLSTILVGNNIVNIASASVSTVLFVKWFNELGVTLSTIVMTVLILIFGEISPKSISKDMPEKMAMFSAPILKVFIFILTPINYIFSLWKKMLKLIFKVSDDRSITDEELITIVEEAQEEGGINEDKGNLIKNAIEFNDLDVSDILTPRVDVVAVENTITAKELACVFLESGYSRLPVFENTIDNIIGMVFSKDFNNSKLKDDQKINKIIKPALHVPYSTKISKLLRVLQQKKVHMAIITDEYGGTRGIVTIEDILEELVGEIWDEDDEVFEEIKKIKENEYLVLGATHIEKMFEYFNLNDKELDCESSTVSGFILEMLEKFPEQGYRFEYENLDIIITRIGSKRIKEVKVIVTDREKEGDLE